MENPVISAGTVINQKLVCQYSNMITSSGIWYGHNPFDYTTPVLLTQIVLIFVVTRTIHLLLRPLRQTMIISQVLAGILIGPSFLAQNKTYSERFFSEGSKFLLRTFAEFGLMLHLFVLGVQIDVGLLKSMGRRPVIIGLSGTMVSILFGGSTYKIIQQTKAFDSNLEIGISHIVPGNAMTSFVVTSSLLTDLKILNSELGRLASSASMVSDAFGWFMAFIMTNISDAIGKSTLKPLFTVVIIFIYYGILFFLMRPLVIWIVSHTVEGKTMKESHFFAVICIAIWAGFLGEYLGQHAGFGTFMFGLSLPAGPPLGSHLVRKLDILASSLLLPLFCTISGLRTDLRSLAKKSSAKIELIIIMGYIGKLAGTILPSLYYEIPRQEALLLGLIMCCRGIMEITIFSLWKDMQILNNQLFALLIISMLIVTAIATPIVSSLYDPSSRYMASTRRTIIDTKPNLDLRLLVCIHREENAHPIINLLEASNPTRNSPISTFVLQLVELSGRTTAILRPHNKPCGLGSNLLCSSHIVNAFNKFERHTHGHAIVQHFTAVSPYVSMHDDICTLALDKKVSIVIVPFHKLWGIDGKLGASFPSIRTLNQNVLKKAPCSVGVLVDRSDMCGNTSVHISESLYHIAMLFLGGADDTEALAYSKRMAEHPNVSLTVVWFKAQGSNTYNNEKNLESDVMMEELRAKVVGKKIIYKEEAVKDGMDTIQIIQMMEDAFDLVIVGKHHDPKSPVILGLTDWSEYPELGIIGDILATSDYRFSVLVVQQQPLGPGLQESSSEL